MYSSTRFIHWWVTGFVLPTGMWHTAGEGAGIVPIPLSVHQGPMAQPFTMAMLLHQMVSPVNLLPQPVTLPWLLHQAVSPLNPHHQLAMLLKLHHQVVTLPNLLQWPVKPLH